MTSLTQTKEVFKRIRKIEFEGNSSDNPLAFRWYDGNKINDYRPPPTLQSNRLFAGISPDLLREIVGSVEIRRFEKDEVIFQAGDRGDCLYLVCEGSICISESGRGGKQETLGFVKTDSFFGEMALIDGQPRSAQATAVEQTLLGRVDCATFERIMAIAPRDLHMNFLRSVVERLRGLDAHFITELMRSERLSLVGTMANSIIHDLKNPICVIRSCADLMAKKVTDPVVKDFTAGINRAVENMLDMIQEDARFRAWTVEPANRTAACACGDA